MRVLLSAYACEPNKGSEPGVGWGWAREIAQCCEVWVLTRENNRDQIEAALNAELRRNLRFVYYDLPRWSRWWKRGRRGIHTYYYLWQLGSALVAKRLHAQLRFDVVHHLTLSGYWMPSGLAMLSDVPLILGPVGGAEMLPRQLAGSLSLTGELYELAKTSTHVIARLDPFARLTINRASLILVQSVGTLARMQKLRQNGYVVCSAVGVDCDVLQKMVRVKKQEAHRSFRVVSVGRLLGFKGFHLGLQAFGIVASSVPNCEYVMVGDGPELQRLQNRTRTLGLEAKVRYAGAVPREQVWQEMAKADVLLHPSFRDPPATVIAEALAMGLPVVCLNHAGPGAQVTSDCGIKIPIDDENKVVAGLAKALQRLASDEALRERLSAGARRRALAKFAWSSKRRFIQQQYALAREIG